MLPYAKMPAAMSAIETPTLAGASGVPVTESMPASLCMRRSVGLLGFVGSVFPVARDIADDQARVVGLQGVMGETQASSWPRG